MKINYEWVKDQFAKARVKISVGKPVLELLATWEKLNVKDEDAKSVFDVFSKVAVGHSLVNTPEGEIWIDARPGDIKVADTVRVKNNAFNGTLGNLHNGRIGRIVAIRSGDIIVDSVDGEEPELKGIHYKASSLEKRIR